MFMDGLVSAPYDPMSTHKRKGLIMKSGILCSFYGKDDDCCDVGCDYISSSDVTTIIRHCSADYRSCSRYQELAHSISPRLRDAAQIMPAPGSSRPTIQLKDPLIKPFRVKWSLPSLWHQVATRSALESVPLARHQRAARSLEPAQARQTSAVAIPTASAPLPIGLLGFGAATVLLNLHMSGVLSLGAVLTTMGIFYAGFAQVVSGFMEWRRNNTFGATAFTAYGLFCMALVAVAVMTHTGIAPAPSSSATAACLGLWSLISAAMFLGALRLNLMLRVLFALLTLSFVLLALGHAVELAPLKLVAGYGGMFTGALAVGAGLVRVFKEVYGRRGFVPVPA